MRCWGNKQSERERERDALASHFGSHSSLLSPESWILLLLDYYTLVWFVFSLSLSQEEGCCVQRVAWYRRVSPSSYTVIGWHKSGTDRGGNGKKEPSDVTSLLVANRSTRNRVKADDFDLEGRSMWGYWGNSIACKSEFSTTPFSDSWKKVPTESVHIMALISRTAAGNFGDRRGRRTRGERIECFNQAITLWRRRRRRRKSWKGPEIWSSGTIGFHR